jgi:hypothetical protein
MKGFPTGKKKRIDAMTDTNAPNPLMAYLDTLPRKLLRWVSVLGAVGAMGALDAVGVPLDALNRGVILGFVAAVYGIRGIERIKGVGS